MRRTSPEDERRTRMALAMIFPALEIEAGHVSIRRSPIPETPTSSLFGTRGLERADEPPQKKTNTSNPFFSDTSESLGENADKQNDANMTPCA